MLDVTKALLVFGASALVVGILYLLRERSRKAVVSYLPLWDLTLKKTPATTLMRRFRRIFSYMLQLAIIILLILSITETGYGRGKHRRAMAILVDTSASMASTDLKPSRLDRAVKLAAKLADSMKEEDRALVLGMSDSPKVIHSWTGSPREIKDSLKGLKITTEGNDFISALSLSAAALDGMDAAEKQIWVLSDGAYDPADEKLRLLRETVKEIGQKGIDVYQYRTGRESANLAITRFSARQNLKEKLKLSANVVLGSFQKGRQGEKEGATGKTQECEKINLKIISGENTVLSKAVDRRVFGEIIPLDIPVPASRTLEARISPGGSSCKENFLLLDDSARILLPEQLQLKILAITRQNTYLMAALLLSPLWDVEVTENGGKHALEAYDVVIGDRSPVPDDIRRRGTLYIQPPQEGLPMAVKGEIEAESFDEFDYSHPALRWTNLYNVNVARAVLYEPRKEDKVIAASAKGPLIIEMNGESGRGGIVLAFSLQDTDMPLRTTWPLFFINMLYYLSGTAMQVSSASNSPEESNIMPRWLPLVKRAKQDPVPYRSFPLWVILLLGALLLVMLEWLSFHRRWTV
jgi:Ca-activated chloride channel family protein